MNDAAWGTDNGAYKCRRGSPDPLVTWKVFCGIYRGELARLQSLGRWSLSSSGEPQSRAQVAGVSRVIR